MNLQAHTREGVPLDVRNEPPGPCPASHNIRLLIRSTAATFRNNTLLTDISDMGNHQDISFKWQKHIDINTTNAISLGWKISMRTKNVYFCSDQQNLFSLPSTSSKCQKCNMFEEFSWDNELSWMTGTPNQLTIKLKVLLICVYRACLRFTVCPKPK